MNAIARAFLDHFDDDYFPQALLEAFEPTGCLAKKSNCETYLLKHRETGRAYVAKAYAHEARQLNEGEILRGLDYPGIPRAFGEFEGGEALFIVREYIEGRSISDLIADRTMGLRQALKLMLHLADIVAFLQRQRPQIVHRDIKPSNLIVDDEGKLWLIDFEIARRVDPESRSSDTVLMLTENYAAPEQFGYQQTDGRTDIYAMGVVFLFLLTGGIDLKRTDELVASPGARAIIQKCTAFAPGDRYPSAEALKKALLRLDASATRRARIRHPIALTATISFVCGMICMFFFARAGGLPLINRAPAPIATSAAAPRAFTAPPNAPGGETVVFESPIIERAVLRMLGKTEGEQVYEDELSQVTKLLIFYGSPVAYDQDYDDLASGVFTNPRLNPVELGTLNDLKMLPELSRVKLAGMIVPDIEPLFSLSKLVQLDIEYCPKVDLSGLSACPSLQWLSLRDTEAVSYEPLRALAELRGLTLTGTGICDYSFLEGLENLVSFVLFAGDAASVMPYLAGRQLSYMNLIALDNLTVNMLSQVDATDYVGLWSCAFKDLVGIERMTKMKRLELGNTRVSDYSQLLALPNLQSLTVESIERPTLMKLPQPLPFEVTYK